MPRSDDPLARLVEKLELMPGLAQTLPGDQGALVQDALDGKKVYDIANDHRVPESYVWEVLGNAARLAAGQGFEERTEIGGLGSDTDPGVTGGYGDTGFGAIGNEGPIPNPGEPGGSAEAAGGE
jgi:hypothetical protein